MESMEPLVKAILAEERTCTVIRQWVFDKGVIVHKDGQGLLSYRTRKGERRYIEVKDPEPWLHIDEETNQVLVKSYDPFPYGIQPMNVRFYAHDEAVAMMGHEWDVDCDSTYKWLVEFDAPEEEPYFTTGALYSSPDDYVWYTIISKHKTKLLEHIHNVGREAFVLGFPRV
jgi:hypothetical protein